MSNVRPRKNASSLHRRVCQPCTRSRAEYLSPQALLGRSRRSRSKQKYAKLALKSSSVVAPQKAPIQGVRSQPLVLGIARIGRQVQPELQDKCHCTLHRSERRLHNRDARQFVATRARCGFGVASGPNPSIEGTPKRLRLLCAPHVKR